MVQLKNQVYPCRHMIIRIMFTNNGGDRVVPNPSSLTGKKDNFISLLNGKDMMLNYTTNNKKIVGLWPNLHGLEEKSRTYIRKKDYALSKRKKVLHQETDIS